MRRIQLDGSLIGTVVEGDFTIVEFLGAGAMGATYRARQMSLAREVCIKFLSVSFLSDAESVRRFKREARVLARLKHKNIVECYSFGVLERVYPYLVLELIEGESLRSVLANGAIDWTRSCSIVAQTADALQYAHAHGIIHRDVKPDNIMLCRQDSSDFVKLIDFGLAGKVGSVAGVDTLTAPGTTLGTPNYMAPEAFTGLSGTSADIYALGCVLHECLSAAVPFGADNTVAVMRGQLADFLPPLPATVKPDEVRGALDRIIRRATEKSSSDRYASCGQLGQVLRHISDSPHLIEEFVAPVASAPGRRPWYFIVAAVSFALVASVGIATRLSFRPASSPDPSVISSTRKSIFSEIVSKLRLSAVSREPANPSVVQNELVALTAESAALTTRWKSPGCQTDKNDLGDKSRLFCTHFERFLCHHGQFLNQLLSCQLQVRDLCFALTDFSGVLPAESPAGIALGQELMKLQCELLVSFGCYRGAKEILQNRAPLKRGFPIEPNHLADLVEFHRTLGKIMTSTGIYFHSDVLRSAVDRYKRLPDGSAFFLEFLRWNRNGCAQRAYADCHRYSLFAAANEFTFSDQTWALRALLDSIEIEATNGRVEEAGLAMDVLLRKFSPQQYDAMEVAVLLVKLNRLKEAEDLLCVERNAANSQKDNFRWCAAESTRLQLLATTSTSIVPDILALLHSPQWRQVESSWSDFCVVFEKLLTISHSCLSAGRKTDALALLEQCQILLLEKSAQLGLQVADAPTVSPYGYYLYQLVECFTCAGAFKESLPAREYFLHFMEKNESSFPDGFFPFASRIEMAQALSICGRKREADVLYQWCDAHLEKVFKTCRTGGWQAWFSVRARWFRSAGYSRAAEAIEAEVSRKPFARW